MSNITTLEKEKANRGLSSDKYINTIHALSVKSSLLPSISVDTNDNVVDTIFCESISGGQNYVNGMPSTLTLTRLEYVDSQKQLIRTYGGNYILKKDSLEIKTITDIEETTIEGKLLIMAIAKLSTESQTDKTPDEILKQLQLLLVNEVYT